MALRRGFRIFSVCLAAALAAYFTWARYDRVRPPLDVRLQLESQVEVDSFRGRGNIIGVSPWMVPTDYASRQHLMNKLDGYLQVAKSLGWIRPGTVVVFPEHIGTWLIVEGEKSAIFRAATIDEGLLLFAGSNLFRYLREWFTAPDGTRSRTRHSIFSLKAARMARSYQEVFGALARKYRVTVVAGSILLSNPTVRDGVLQTDMGALSNAGAVFHPDGRIDPRLYCTAHPGDIESEFVRGCARRSPPVYDLPVGRTAVVLSDDAWHADAYPAAGVDIVLSPALYSPDNAMASPWGASSEGLRLSEAIIRHGLPARLPACGAREGLMVPLRGRMWDVGSDGGILAVSDSVVHQEGPRVGAGMLNLNLR